MRLDDISLKLLSGLTHTDFSELSYDTQTDDSNTKTDLDIDIYSAEQSGSIGQKSAMTNAVKPLTKHQHLMGAQVIERSSLSCRPLQFLDFETRIQVLARLLEQLTTYHDCQFELIAETGGLIQCRNAKKEVLFQLSPKTFQFIIQDTRTEFLVLVLKCLSMTELSHFVFDRTLSRAEYCRFWHAAHRLVDSPEIDWTLKMQALNLHSPLGTRIDLQLGSVSTLFDLSAGLKRHSH